MPPYVYTGHIKVHFEVDHGIPILEEIIEAVANGIIKNALDDTMQPKDDADLPSEVNPKPVTRFPIPVTVKVNSDGDPSENPILDQVRNIIRDQINEIIRQNSRYIPSWLDFHITISVSNFVLYAVPTAP